MTSDGQRLGLLLAMLAPPSTALLGVAARHPWRWLLRLIDVVFAWLTAPYAGACHAREIEMDVAPGVVLPARLYEPPTVPDGAPLLVYFHGGGWVLGSLDSHDNVCRFIACSAACKVLAVGYRKAPAHRFPAAFEDCRAAYRWAVQRAVALGADPDRIAVGGDSAGANLAAAAALAEHGDLPSPCFAWLIYPLVDADVDAYPSVHEFARGPLITRQSLRDLIHQYAPRPAEQLDARVSVVRSPELGAMPPTYIATAGMDPLRDQGEQFGVRLRAAGVHADVRRFANLPHAFGVLLVDRGARRAAAETCAALRQALHGPPPGDSASENNLLTGELHNPLGCA